jgi:hypothetical protein
LDPSEVDDDDIVHVLANLSGTAERPEDIHQVATIDEAEWTHAQTITEVFEGFRDVMTVLESDRFGTTAEIWRGYLWLCTTQGGEISQLVEGWREAQAVWSRWIERYSTIPTKEQRDITKKRLTTLLLCQGDDNPGKLIALRSELTEIEHLVSVPLFQFTALLRPSNLHQIQHLLGEGNEWSHVLACAKVVFDSVKRSIPEWIAEQRRLSEAEDFPSSRRGRFSLTDEIPLPGRRGMVPPKTEWDRYFEPEISAREDSDLMGWWHSHREMFPVWYHLAQTYLCLPATSAGVERMFSKSRRVLTRLRLRTTGDHADTLVFLRENRDLVEKLEQDGKTYW